MNILTIQDINELTKLVTDRIDFLARVNSSNTKILELIDLNNRLNTLLQEIIHQRANATASK